MLPLADISEPDTTVLFAVMFKLPPVVPVFWMVPPDLTSTVPLLAVTDKSLLPVFCITPPELTVTLPYMAVTPVIPVKVPPVTLTF